MPLWNLCIKMINNMIGHTIFFCITTDISSSKYILSFCYWSFEWLGDIMESSLPECDSSESSPLNSTFMILKELHYRVSNKRSYNLTFLWDLSNKIFWQLSVLIMNESIKPEYSGFYSQMIAVRALFKLSSVETSEFRIGNVLLSQRNLEVVR